MRHFIRTKGRFPSIIWQNVIWHGDKKEKMHYQDLVMENTNTSKPHCPYFTSGKCLSCSLLNESYESTLVSKQAHLQSLFPEVRLRDPIPSPLGLESRNKAKNCVGGTLESPLIGRPDRQGNCLETLDCPLHAPGINAILHACKDWIRDFSLVPYDVKARKGELKYLIVTKSESTGEALLRFVVRSHECLNRLKELIPIAQAKFPLLKVISANIQPLHAAIFEGEEEIILTQEKFITWKMDDVTLFTGPRCFFQTNSHVATGLYQRSREIVNAIRPSSLLDLFCGVGCFSFFNKQVPKITGIEISPNAIEAAEAAKGANNSPALEFLAAPVESFITKSWPKDGTLIVNPPRRGLGPVICEWINQTEFENILYSSCSPDSLKRDIDTLAGDYYVESLELFDMFPYNTHYETLALLKRRY
jgi:23S rRNA (uracil747-C5)-methyltransferase